MVDMFLDVTFVVRMYAWMYLCMYGYVNKYKYTHTHTHTHILLCVHTHTYIIVYSTRTHIFQDEVRKWARTFVSSEETCRGLSHSDPFNAALGFLSCYYC
jgi:hypothetical protein